MSATNSTTNYGLPIFLSQDVPSWLTDWNSAMSDIDTAIAAAKTAADGAQLTASNAQAAATQNAGAITQLQTTVGSLSGNVTSLSGAVNTINSLIGNGTPTTTDHTLIGAINELHADQGDLADLQTTDKSSLVAAINEAAQGGSTPTAAQVTYDNTTSGLSATDVQEAIDELSVASGGATTSQLTDALSGTSFASNYVVKSGSIVYFHANIVSNTEFAASSQVVGVLPSGFRPSSAIVTGLVVGATAAGVQTVGRLSVATTGAITVQLVLPVNVTQLVIEGTINI